MSSTASSPVPAAAAVHSAKSKGAVSAGFQEWINRCQIQCKLCPMTFTNDGVAANHFRSAHGLELQEYKNQFGNIWTTVVHYTCPNCQESVMQSAMFMGKHIRSCANMSAFEFYNKYVSPPENSQTPSTPAASQDRQGNGVAVSASRDASVVDQVWPLTQFFSVSFL